LSRWGIQKSCVGVSIGILFLPMSVTPSPNRGLGRSSPVPREEAIARMEAYQDALARAFADGSAAYDALFERPPARIAAHEIDTAKRLTRVNAVELEMLGYRAEQMLGHAV